MKVEIIKECGYEEAMLGLSLSYNKSPKKMANVAARLYNKDGGHNKFLESMMVWIDITAPRYWWQQFDAYRIGVTKQSGSTMHTITKRELTQGDFSDLIDKSYLEYLNLLVKQKNILALKAALPEGFLQRRVVCTNYKALRGMLIQRSNHKLLEWHIFCLTIKSNIEHNEFFDDIVLRDE